MQRKRFKPLIDKLFFIIFIPTLLLVLSATVIPAIFARQTLFWTAPIVVFVLYFLISPLFGWVELRDEALFIKYGFFLKKEIPYGKIRGTEIKKSFYAESMMSLKNSFEHVNIKYNAFDVTSVSVVGNEELIQELEHRCAV